jgi:predicted nucleic-acid-binding protein
VPPSLIVDANILVRYLTGDDPAQSPQATDLFRAANTGQVRLIIPTTAVQETVYALETYYHHDASVIGPKLLSLLALPNVEAPDARWLIDGIQWYRSKNSDFGDALICAYASHMGCELATFDIGILKKFTEITASTPADWLAKHRQAVSKPT